MPIGSDASRALGDRVRAERLRTGITQMDLANLAGLNVANYGRIERGVGNPSLDTLLRVAKILGVEASALITGISADQLGPTRPRFTAADFLKERSQRS